MSQNQNNSRGVFVIFATALVTLILLSLLPWGDFTGHVLKDFNLFGDLMPRSDKSFITHEEIDPELLALASESDAEVPDSTLLPSGEAANEVVADLPDDFTPPMRDGSILIEDYSPDSSGLASLRHSLANSASSPLRIAFVGDSYIEGDILTQDIRTMLQETYGGHGVGYMPVFSPIPGFRRSVRQSGSGWEAKEIRDMGSNDYRTLQGIYFTSDGNGRATFKGTKSPAGCDSWDCSTVAFIAPESGTMTLATDAANDVREIQASDDVQTVRIQGHTTSFSLESDIAGLVVLGVYLDGASGVILDNMSLRGNSGISHRNLNSSVTRTLRDVADYKLIILEFGINALTSQQTDYTAYSNAMKRAIATIRANYPEAQILMLGIGDRGQKQGTEVGSIATAPAMVAAQRNAARSAGVMFWDTRAAMGGDGSVVDWHKRGLVNSDYIHLNHKGGKELAGIFVNSLILSINE